MTSAADDAVLAALEFTIPCGQVDCEAPAEVALSAFHLAPSGQGWNPRDECEGAAAMFCRAHARRLATLLGGTRGVCHPHGREAVARWGTLSLPPA